MASGSNDDSRSLHVPPNVFCNFTRGLRIACGGEAKCCRIEDNLWDICIVYAIATNRRVTRLKGAIEGHGH
jgi:hypothetical protein